MNRHPLSATTTLLVLASALAAGSPQDSAATNQAAELVAKIRRADYEGDRSALRVLYSALAPLREQDEIAARVRYWQGFALWRRAFNGFNESAETDARTATEAALADRRRRLDLVGAEA